MDDVKRSASWMFEGAVERAKTLHRKASSITEKVADTIATNVAKVGDSLEESEARGDGDIAALALGSLGALTGTPVRSEAEVVSHFETVDLGGSSRCEVAAAEEGNSGYSYEERRAQLEREQRAEEQRLDATSPAGTPNGGGFFSWIWGSTGKYAPLATPAKPSRSADMESGGASSGEGGGAAGSSATPEPTTALGKLWGSVRRGSQHVGAAVGMNKPPPSLTPRMDAFIARLEKHCGCCPEMSYMTRMIATVVLVCLAGGFFALAYVVGIPMLLAAPDKFALCFTFGTACFLGAVVVLDGPIRYVRRLGSLHRMWPLVAVVATSVGTIVCSFGVQNVFRSVAVIAVSIAQICALVWYGFAFVPGGVTGLKFIVNRMCALCSSLKG